VNYMDADGRDLPETHHHRAIPSEKIYHALLRSNFLVPSTIMMVKSVVRKVGLFDPKFRRLQDWELWLRLAKDGHLFIGTSDRLVRYRLHAESLTKDTSGGKQAVFDLVSKHFGTDEGDVEKWSIEKRRAYGGAYRYQVLAAVQHQHDWQQCRGYLRKALQIDPSLACDIDLFYELALGNQPWGYRGTSSHLNVEENADRLIKLMKVLFQGSEDLIPRNTRVRAIATAYQAMGMLAYNRRLLNLSRGYFWAGMRLEPGLLLDRRVSGAIVKSLLGGSMLERMRGMRRTISTKWIELRKSPVDK
jgi:hypothetical protein